MIIAVAGLGLIGGSICKTLKKHTAHTVLGLDADADAAKQAKDCGAVDEIIDKNGLCRADITFVCMHPKTTVGFISENISEFAPGSVVSDVCGVKQYIIDSVEAKLYKAGINFVGTHPMAGREFSGFAYTLDDLFDNASFIITKTEKTSPQACEKLKRLAGEMRFKEVVFSTPAEHDRNIAFTSQLAHIVSNAYIKSPQAVSEHGFSAGSFLDLTRVAKLNAPMWTELFLANAKNLSEEIETIMNHLSEYKAALDDKNAEYLTALLKDGSDRKEYTLKNSQKK